LRLAQGTVFIWDY